MRAAFDVAATVGDFVVARADGVPAYQLAVVVDDAAMEVTDVVRGDDLLPSTARQILLYRALGLPVPRLRPRPAGGRPGRRAARQAARGALAGGAARGGGGAGGGGGAARGHLRARAVGARCRAGELVAGFSWRGSRGRRRGSRPGGGGAAAERWASRPCSATDLLLGHRAAARRRAARAPSRRQPSRRSGGPGTPAAGHLQKP